MSEHANISGGDPPLVGRGGLKLAHALEEFRIDVHGLVAADFGCNIGGFTDCLLRRGAARVYAVDTGYGALAWKLRQDPRVVVMERTNALHAEPPANEDGSVGVDLVVIDLAWTPQEHAIPAAMRWLRRGGVRDRSVGIVTLIKPHYEERAGMLRAGVLSEEDAQRVLSQVVASIPAMGGGRTLELHGLTRSPILGRKGKARGPRRQRLRPEDDIGKGNAEWLAWVVPG